LFAHPEVVSELLRVARGTRDMLRQQRVRDKKLPLLLPLVLLPEERSVLASLLEWKEPTVHVLEAADAAQLKVWIGILLSGEIPAALR
jgi:hypothetical protein